MGCAWRRLARSRLIPHPRRWSRIYRKSVVNNTAVGGKARLPGRASARSSAPYDQRPEAEPDEEQTVRCWDMLESDG
jgi:hypothetical protein